MDTPVFSFSLWTLAYAYDCECVEVDHHYDVSMSGKGFRNNLLERFLIYVSYKELYPKHRKEQRTHIGILGRSEARA